MSSSADKDYEVGNRKPPKHSQFKKGQSGNPQGRRRAQPKQIDLGRLLNPELTINKDGAPKRMSAYEIYLRRLVSQALEEKKIAAIGRLLDLFEEHRLLSLPPKPANAFAMRFHWTFFFVLERDRLVNKFGLEAVTKIEKELNITPVKYIPAPIE